MTFKYDKTLVSIGAENVEQICQFYQALLNQPPSIYRESIYAEFNLAGLVLAIFKPRPNEQDEFFNEEQKVLMMYRLGKWDLPKGKGDDNEKAKQTAEREVEEECGIKVQLSDKLCTTWHTYTMGTRKILKRTKWYKMNCIDESKMQPQTEEGIEKLEWMTEKEMQTALLNSYSSIRYVIDQLKEKNEIEVQ